MPQFFVCITRTDPILSEITWTVYKLHFFCSNAWQPQSITIEISLNQQYFIGNPPARVFITQIANDLCNRRCLRSVFPPVCDAFNPSHSPGEKTVHYTWDHQCKLNHVIQIYFIGNVLHVMFIYTFRNKKVIQLLSLDEQGLKLISAISIIWLLFHRYQFYILHDINMVLVLRSQAGRCSQWRPKSNSLT